jgi:hypothetical protein
VNPYTQPKGLRRTKTGAGSPIGPVRDTTVISVYAPYYVTEFVRHGHCCTEFLI